MEKAESNGREENKEIWHYSTDAYGSYDAQEKERQVTTMAGGLSASWQALRMLPRTAYKVAGRITRDIGSNDPKLARAALKMVGYHAAAGATLGGAYSSYNGNGFGRGAIRGGIAGAGFGMMGGTGLIRNVGRRGFDSMASKTYGTTPMSNFTGRGAMGKANNFMMGGYKPFAFGNRRLRR